MVPRGDKGGLMTLAGFFAFEDFFHQVFIVFRPLLQGFDDELFLCLAFRACHRADAPK